MENTDSGSASGGGSGGGGAGGDGGAAAASSGDILQVAVSTKHLDSETAEPELHETCKVPAGTAVGTDTTCSVYIPEGQLFWSSLDFELSVSKSNCYSVEFRPYYYQASGVGGFKPVWNSYQTVNCAETLDGDPTKPKSENCYNGPAKKLLGSAFPRQDTVRYATNNDGFSKAFSFENKGVVLYSNRFFTNSLSARSTSLNFGSVGEYYDGYVAGTMKDYLFTCRDKYEDKLQRLYIYVYERDGSTIEVVDWTTQTQ